jgi:hypothetical protein
VNIMYSSTHYSGHEIFGHCSCPVWAFAVIGSVCSRHRQASVSNTWLAFVVSQLSPLELLMSTVHSHLPPPAPLLTQINHHHSSPTPPLLFRNFFQCNIDQQTMMNQVDAILQKREGGKSLFDLGYSHVGLDDWYGLFFNGAKYSPF